jgi:hypothetical protein
LDFALANAGKSILARIAMMAITTNSSINVNARVNGEVLSGHFISARELVFSFAPIMRALGC